MGCKPTTYLTPEEEDGQLPIRRRSNVLNVSNHSFGQRQPTSEGEATKPIDRKKEQKIIDLEVNSQ